MAPKPSESAAGRHRTGSAKDILNSNIDFSDIPDSTAEELKRAVRVGRRDGFSCKDHAAAW